MRTYFYQIVLAHRPLVKTLAAARVFQRVSDVTITRPSDKAAAAFRTTLYLRGHLTSARLTLFPGPPSLRNRIIVFPFPGGRGPGRPAGRQQRRSTDEWRRRSVSACTGRPEVTTYNDDRCARSCESRYHVWNASRTTDLSVTAASTDHYVLSYVFASRVRRKEWEREREWKKKTNRKTLPRRTAVNPRACVCASVRLCAFRPCETRANMGHKDEERKPLLLGSNNGETYRPEREPPATTYRSLVSTTDGRVRCAPKAASRPRDVFRQTCLDKREHKRALCKRFSACWTWARLNDFSPYYCYVLWYRLLPLRFSPSPVTLERRALEAPA